MRGRDKLLEEVDGLPLLVRQVHAALRLDVPVLVTLPSDQHPRHALVSGTKATSKVPANSKEGISASLRTGAEWAAKNDFSGLMIILPDLPDITSDDLSLLAGLHEKHPDTVMRATSADGQPGHPTVIPARLFPAMRQLTGDTGARDILRTEKIRPCPLAGTRAITDLDTPQAWATWRAARR